MWKDKKITVVIPTLNEAAGIAQTIASIPKFVDEILVVDGASKDGTADVATKAGARVVVQPKRGYGLAFLTGFAHATGDIIATADGDGTYPIELLEKILEKMPQENWRFVSGARFPLSDRSSMRKRNFIGNWGMTLVASILWGHRFRDVLSGMWVFERSVLNDLTLLSDGWNLSEEIKIQAHQKLGAGFGEFHIPYRERLGETKLVPWKVGIENLVYLFAMRTGTVPAIQALLGKPRKSRLLVSQ